MHTIRSKGLLAAAALLLVASGARADSCRSESFESAKFVVCSFDLAKDDLRIFWRDGESAPYRTFPALAEALESKGLTLTFAMNGGMYGDDFSPTGLYVEEGRELAAINTRNGQWPPGQIPNFYKKPNGVFYVAGKTAGVMTTDAWLAVPAEGRTSPRSQARCS